MARSAVVYKLSPYLLHGVQYYQLSLVYPDQPGVVQEARLAQEAVYPNPQEGDEVMVDMILNMITAVRKKE